MSKYDCEFVLQEITCNFKAALPEFMFNMTNLEQESRTVCYMCVVKAYNKGWGLSKQEEERFLRRTGRSSMPIIYKFDTDKYFAIFDLMQDPYDGLEDLPIEIRRDLESSNPPKLDPKFKEDYLAIFELIEDPYSTTPISPDRAMAKARGNVKRYPEVPLSSSSIESQSDFFNFFGEVVGFGKHYKELNDWEELNEDFEDSYPALTTLTAFQETAEIQFGDEAKASALEEIFESSNFFEAMLALQHASNKAKNIDFNSYENRLMYRQIRRKNRA